MTTRWLLAAVVGCSIVACGSEAAESPDGVLALYESEYDDELAAFHRVPLLLVTTDSRAIMAAPADLAVQGELLPDVWVRTISAEGVERLRSADVSDDPTLDELLGVIGGEHLGPLEFFLPTEYLAIATPIDDAGTRPVIEWPADASTRLGDALTCRRFPELEVGEALETAAAESVFSDGGVIYEVRAKQAWPGATC